MVLQPPTGGTGALPHAGDTRENGQMLMEFFLESKLTMFGVTKDCCQRSLYGVPCSGRLKFSYSQLHPRPIWGTLKRRIHK